LPTNNSLRLARGRQQYHQQQQHLTTTSDFNLAGSNNTGLSQTKSPTYRNHVTISVKNRTFSALIDTGACRSVASLDLVKSLKYSLKPLDSNELGFLISANGTGMGIVGQVDLPIKIEGLITYHTFCVTAQVTHQLILGLDILESMDAKIDLKNKTVSFYDNLVQANLTVISDRDKQFVSTTAKVKLQPMAETIIPVSVVNSYPLQTSIIEPLPDDQQKFLVARSAVTLKQHETVCRLLNPTDTLITIPRNTLLLQLNRFMMNV